MADIGAAPSAAPSPGLLSLPDPVLLHIFHLLRYGHAPRAGHDVPARRPRVVVGMKRPRYDDGAGRPVARASGCRVLASTCTRLRDLFRADFVRRAEMSAGAPAAARAVFCVGGEGEGRGEYVRAGGVVHVCGMVRVVQAYAAGLTALTLTPAVAIRLHREAARRWPEAGAGRGKALRLMFPRLKEVRLMLSLSDFSNEGLKLLPGERRPCHSSLAQHKETAESIVKEAMEAIPVDLACFGVQSCGRLSQIFGMQRMCSRVALEGHTRLQALELGCDLDAGTHSPMSMFPMGPFWLPGHFAAWSPNFDSLESLRILGDVHIDSLCALLNRLPSLKDLLLSMSVLDYAMLSSALPLSLRHFKLLPRNHRAVYDKLDFSRLSLSTLELQNAQLDDATEPEMYIYGLSTVDASKLKLVSLAFLAEVNLDGRLARCLENLSGLEEVRVGAACENFANALCIAAKAPRAAKLHLVIITTAANTSCVFSVLRDLQQHQSEAASVVTINFSGTFTCNRPGMMAHFEARARAVCPRLERVCFSADCGAKGIAGTSTSCASPPAFPNGCEVHAAAVTGRAA